MAEKPVTDTRRDGDPARHLTAVAAVGAARQIAGATARSHAEESLVVLLQSLARLMEAGAPGGDLAE